MSQDVAFHRRIVQPTSWPCAFWLVRSDASMHDLRKGAVAGVSPGLSRSELVFSKTLYFRVPILIRGFRV